MKYTDVRSKCNHIDKIVVSEAENAFLHIEYCGGDLGTEQCDDCVNLGMSAKPEMMVHIPRFWRY